MSHLRRRSALRTRCLGVACAVLAILTGCTNAEQDDVADPTGTIAVADTQDFRTLFLVDPGSRIESRVRAPDRMGGADFSTDGHRLAISGYDGIWTFARSGADADLLQIEPSTTMQALGSVAWSPQSHELAYTDGGGLFLTRTSGEEPRRLAAGDDFYDADWSPTGDRIAFVRDTSPAPGDEALFVIDSDGTGLRRIVSGESPAISPDGSTVAFVLRDAVHVVAMDGGQPKLVVRNAFHPEWSPDGNHLAFTRDVECSEGGCVGRIFIMPSAGGNARAVGPVIFDIGPLSWSR